MLSSQWEEGMLDEAQWEETAQSIEEHIEKSFSEWCLIDIKEEAVSFDKIAFLDGIQRTDGDIFDTKEKVRFKLFSLASGICEIKYGVFNDFDAFKSIKTKKIAIPDKNIEKDYIKIGNAFYNICQELQDKQLKNLEYESLIDYMKNSDTKIVVWDGSLPFVINQTELEDRLIFGLIKSHKKYFTKEHLDIIYDIKAYQRSPIIHYTDQAKYFYYTWYTTLNDNMTGLVRIETLANMDIKKASHLANNISFVLRYFASSPLYDQRAPQNIAPIGSLESYLRAYIGHYFFDVPELI